MRDKVKWFIVETQAMNVGDEGVAKMIDRLKRFRNPRRIKRHRNRFRKYRHLMIVSDGIPLR